MQNLSDHNGPFKIPAGWHQVTTRQFCESDPLDSVQARANYFAGRSVLVDEKVELDWMHTAPASEMVSSIDIGQSCYLAVETMRSVLAEGQLTTVFAKVYGHYLACHMAEETNMPYTAKRATDKAAACQDWPITDTYPAVIHCLAELKRLALAYAELSEPDPTEAARRAREAGADELMGMFGHFNVANALSQRLSITLDEAYQLPYNTVCVYLLHDRRSAILADTIQRNANKSNE